MLKAGLLVLAEMQREICNALRNSRTPTRSKNFLSTIAFHQVP